ncbi:MAG: transporter substrate-binding domain-containing protein [Campylobacteraceae bacterium]|nr:transporter substrate-binding domain-containing protein [Campylobacteraceae bacterium]
MKIIFLFAFIILFSFDRINANEIIKISTFPYNGLFNQISQEILKKAYGKNGFSVEFIKLPPRRALMYTNKGKADAELNRIKGIEKTYKNLIMVPTVLQTVRFVVFSKSKDLDIKSWNDLKKYSISYQRGVKLLEIKTKNMNTSPVKSTKEALEMLNLDRVNIVVSTYLSGSMYLKKANYTKIYLLDKELDHIPLYHYIHKNHKYLVPIIDKTLKKMKRSKEFDEIIKKVKLRNGFFN